MRLSGTRVTAIASGKGFGNQLWDLAGTIPTLDLRFAENKSLVDATTGANLVTFTRASSGTYVGSDGLIKTATTNLLLRSEEFDNAYWSKTNSTVTANATTAPNGTLTAEKLITNSGASGGRVNVSITATAGTPVTLSCYAKQGETNIFSLFISDGITGRAAEFNLTTGTVSGTPTAGMTASIQPVGDGWYRCVATVAGASLSGTTRSLRIVQNVVANDGTSGLFIWGAQLEESSTVGEYIPTTSTINSAPRFDHNPTTGESLGLLVEEQRTNLLVQSSFGSIGTTTANNTWYETFAELDTTVNAGLAPDGTTTASLLSINTPTSFRSVIQRTTSTTAGTYALSIYLKPNSTDTSARVMLSGDTGASNFVRADFTLSGAGTAPGSAGVGGTAVSAAAPAIQALPNGWYRCTIAGTLTAPTGITIFVYPGTTGSQTTNSQTLVWGAQLEAGSFPTSYIPTTTATVTRSADVASITGSNWSSWGSSTTGTYYLEASVTRSSASAAKVFLGTSTSPAESYYLYQVQNQNDLRTFDSTTVLDTVNVISDGITFKGGIAYSSADSMRSLVLDGGAVVEGAFDGTYGTDLSIGSRIAGGAPTTGTIRRLTYWPQRLPNSTLQQITQ